MGSDDSILSLKGDPAPEVNPASGVRSSKVGDPAKRVGAIISKARRKAGLSQNRLANRLDRCQSYISKIESGARLVGFTAWMWVVS